MSDFTAIKAGYNRQIITPENGTWLGGYGNGKDRKSIGKIFADDDLFVTALALTDQGGETAAILTVDVVRMPYMLFKSARKRISEKTGIKEKNIFISATHSHSSPEAVDAFIECFDVMKAWANMFLDAASVAVSNALADMKNATVFIGRKKAPNLNFVRRYMKDGEFLGTNRKGDAHETQADNELQVIKFVCEGAKDIVLANWGAHADHSKDIGGEKGTPEYHCGCSADYIYPLRKTVENKADVRFAFFQASAGNLNARSQIDGEHTAVEARAEKEGVMRYIAYGEELSEHILYILENSLTPVNAGNVRTAECELSAARPKGVEIGSADYNIAYAVSVLIYGKNILEEPTAESISAGEMLIKEYNLKDIENVNEILKDNENPLYYYALCAKILISGGKIDEVNSFVVECAKKVASFLGMTSGPYSSGGILRKANESKLPPVELPLYALSFGDVAFTGTPGEPFDTNGRQIKDASPFKMTFCCEHTGGAFGYFPSKLAWSHGGYEVDATKCAEGTGEKIAENLLGLLNGMKTEQ